MRIFVRHDRHGTVLTVLKLEGELAEHEPFGPLPEGEGALEVEATGGLADTACHEIAERHAVDVRRGALVPRRAGAPERPAPPTTTRRRGRKGRPGHG
jgi:hypothetical protein